MKVIESSFQILQWPDNALEIIEAAGRTCYLSEPKGEPDSFVKRIVARGHESVIEHCSATVRIICDRGVLAELTRHRLASFSVESTRYCRYNDEITVIEPSFYGSQFLQSLWLKAMEDAEKSYISMLKTGATPEQARSVLPNSLKTEIVMSCNFRELRHILDLRCSAKAHPDIKAIMIPLLKEVYSRCPVVFEDIYQKYCSK